MEPTTDDFTLVFTEILNVSTRLQHMKNKVVQQLHTLSRNSEAIDM